VVDIPDAKFNPLGARGIGESGIPGAAGNAIFQDTGKRVRGFPITLDKLMKAQCLSQAPGLMNANTPYSSETQIQTTEKATPYWLNLEPIPCILSSWGEPGFRTLP